MKKMNMLNKKKLIKIFIFAVIVIALIWWFCPRKGTFFYGSNVDKIQSITITNGNTGDMVYIDEADYQYLIDYMNELTFFPYIEMEPRTGWDYSVLIKVNGKMEDFVFAGDKWSINNADYKYVGKSYEDIKGVLKALSEKYLCE